MCKLYVIGNGFDLHHKLDTHYVSYGKFLSEQHVQLYDHFLEFFNLPDIVNERADFLWSSFESKLADLDSESALERSNEYLASPGGSGFRDRDWWSFAIEIENFVSFITDGVNETFEDFISSIQYPNTKNIDLLNLDRNAKYINFNYTPTLTRYYSIDPQNILHIHGQAGLNENNIVLGHGISSKSFLSAPVIQPEGLNNEDLEQWEQHQSDQYDFSFELGKDALQKYFERTYKRTDEIISENEEYFFGLSEVTEVFILGHSLSEIDIPYFIKMVLSIEDSVCWNVSYHYEYEKESHLKALKNAGVAENKIVLIKMQELTA